MGRGDLKVSSQCLGFTTSLIRTLLLLGCFYPLVTTCTLLLQSLYAKKVEVQDYKLLCIARVELKNEKFTLVGILGGWWTLPRLLSQEAFSLIRNGALWHYLENSPKN